MAKTNSVTVLNHCLVTPPLSTEAADAAAVSLPLTFLDMVWLQFSPIERAVFYEIPQLSKSQFVDDIIPKLKNSLSLALKYFLPLAGNLIVPANADSGMPEIRYTHGNSAAVVFAECNNNIDFNHLITNDERSCAEFHPLIPDLKSSLNHDHSGTESEVLVTPVLALQVTLFPNFGLSIGITNHHTVGDASSIFNFMKIWAILHSKLSEGIDADAELLVSDNLPIFDKTLIEDTKGFATILRKQWDGVIKLRKSTVSTESTTKTNHVRKTFVISPKQVEKLKNLVMEKGEKVVHLSSFTVICAYIWTCLLKSRVACGEDGVNDEEENEYFLCPADCRGRLDPPLPANYFGNCLTACLTMAKHGQLVGEEGFQVAVESIGKTIHERLKSKDALVLFHGIETTLETLMMKLNPDKVVGVAGSIRHNYYNLDFGWGKPLKFEFISIDKTGAISLSRGRGSDGYVEVGLSLSKPKMNAFSTIFMEVLNGL